MRATTPDRPHAPASGAGADPVGRATGAASEGAVGRSGHGRGTPDEAPRSAATMVALGVLLVLCYAGPVLVAAGAGVLGTLGAWLRNPALLGAGAGAAVVVVAWLVARWRRRAGDACCPPGSTSEQPAGDPVTSRMEAGDQ